MNYLESRVCPFHQALFESTFPNYVLVAVSSQASILKTNTVMWIDDGKFFDFEGLLDNACCFPMNCSDDWNYAQTVAYLFRHWNDQEGR